MIDDDLRAKIRRLHYAEHWPVGTIASQLGVHHDTVRRAVGLIAPDGNAVRGSKLDAYKPFVRATLEEYPRLRASRIAAMLRGRGYVGSDVVVSRYVRTVRPVSREAFIRVTTLPGEQGQVDWGSFGKVAVGHAKRALSCFVLVLGWSRRIWARFFLDQQIDNFIHAHVLAFRKLRGVPRVVLYDNLRSVVLERVGDHVRFHPRVLELAGHYHFEPRPCAPYRPNEKGKVERAIRYLRESFFAARRFRDVDDLNAQLEDWLAGTADERTCPTDPARRSVRECFEHERPLLMPLPEHDHDSVRSREVIARKQPFVRFDLNLYSVPHELVGERLTLLAGTDEIRITRGFAVVARHRRCWDRDQVIEDPAHAVALTAERRRAKDTRSRDRLRSSCPSADALIASLAKRGSSLGADVVRLCKLLDQHGADALEEAMRIALEREARSAATVAYVLEQRRRARGRAEVIDTALPESVRRIDVDVAHHDLATYDRLLDSNEDDHE
jgi:transposase